MRKKSMDFESINIDTLSDEEIDKYFQPRAVNSRKSLAPLFIYFILRDQPEGKHLTQRQISELLKNDYEISIERKALNRILHSLDDAGVGIVSTSDSGTWLKAA